MRVLVVVAMVVAGLAAAAGPARADDREEARREFALGQAADREGNWQVAIDHYLRANDLVPHPNTLFNIAEDFVRLNKLREAALWYQRYLDAAPDSTDRDRIARTLSELSTRPAPLSVRSLPSGARVKIDNTPVGATPYTGTVPGGFHRISVEHEGRRDAKDINVEFGEPVDLTFTLRAAVGMLRVRGEPAGASVSIDNAPAGTLPVTASIAPGVHTIQVTHPGYTAFATTANVVANAEVEVDAKLSRAGGPSSPSGPSGPAAGGDGTGGDGTGAPPKPVIGYLLGAGGGADLRGGGSVLHAEIGARYGQIDGGIRLGKTTGLTSVELVARWALTGGQIAPFIGAGYIYTADESSASSATAAGYELVGGIRYDLSRPVGRGPMVSLIAEVGARYITTTTTDQDGLPVTETGTIVPLIAALQVIYGR